MSAISTTSTSTIGRVVEKHCPSLASRQILRRRHKTCIFCHWFDTIKNTHPFPNQIGRKILVGMKHITTMVSKLGVPKCQKFKMSAPDCNTVLERTVHSCVNFIKLFSVGGWMNFLLVLFGNYIKLEHFREESTSDPQKSIEITDEMSDDSICYIDRRCFKQNGCRCDQASLHSPAICRQIAIRVNTTSSLIGCLCGCQMCQRVWDELSSCRDRVENTTGCTGRKRLEPLDKLFGDGIFCPTNISNGPGMGYKYPCAKQTSKEYRTQCGSPSSSASMLTPNDSPISDDISIGLSLTLMLNSLRVSRNSVASRPSSLEPSLSWRLYAFQRPPKLSAGESQRDFTDWHKSCFHDNSRIHRRKGEVGRVHWDLTLSNPLFIFAPL